jgi:hypothetical protein
MVSPLVENRTAVFLVLPAVFALRELPEEIDTE